jgi:hypothetical protein
MLEDDMSKIKTNDSEVFHSYREGQLASYTVREERFEGEVHLVAPVVLMCEGVHRGSGGSVLYTEDEVRRLAAHWNGVPVPILHPTNEDGTPISANSPEVIESHNVGRVFNVHWDADAKKLRGEVWVNVRRANAIDASVVATMRAGQPLEVSTGLFSEDERTGGIWNNEEYHRIARNIRADHLALLPGQIGACSIADGCGLRANTRGDNPMKFELKKGDVSFQVHCRMSQSGNWVERLVSSIFSTNQQGFVEIAGKLQRHLDGMDGPNGIHWLEEFWADSLVYRVDNNNMTTLFKVEYMINDAGNVEFVGEPQQVRRETEFVEVTGNEAAESESGKDSVIENNNDNPVTQEEEDEQMARKELIEALTANGSVSWKEEDHERLLALGCDEFANELTQQMSANADSEESDAAADDTTAGGDSEESPEVNEDESDAEAGGDVTDNADQTMDQFIDNAPAHLQGQLKDALKTHSEKRTNLVATIKANKLNKFSDADLAALSEAQLENIVALSQTAGGNYGLRPMGDAPVTANVGEIEPMESPVPFANKENKDGDK